MRSVVVVLPASMCAMMPMLRTLARAASTAATSNPYFALVGLLEKRRLPAVVREGLVGLRHLVGVFAALHRSTEPVAGVQQLVHEPLHHGLLATGARVGDQPAQAQRRRPGRAHLDRHLVGRA